MIDILLATYNGEKYLPQLLESIKRQTYTDWRIIAHDDGSTDSTVSILSECMRSLPEGKMTVGVNFPASGSACCNFLGLVQESEGDYAMFCDQDDVWFDTKIEKTLSHMQELEGAVEAMADIDFTEYTALPVPVLVHTDMTVTDKRLHVIHKSFDEMMGMPKNMTFSERLVQNNVAGATAMMNRALVLMMKGIMDYEKHVVMHDHLAALIAASYGAIGHMEESTMYYRQHGGNVVGANKKNMFSSVPGMYKDFKVNMEKYYRQARIFYYIYGDELSLDLRRMLKDFGRCSKYNKLDRVRVCHKYKIYKIGLKKKIPQLMWI